MTISKLFPEDQEQSLEIIRDNLFTILLNNTDHRLAYSNPGLAIIQQAFRNNPDLANIVHEELQKDSISELYDVDRIRRISEDNVKEINAHLQGYRVLCGSDNILSRRMWQDYANDGKGMALCIEPSPIPQKDSIFKLFKEVKYFTERPTLFASTLEFLSGSLFEEQEALIARTIDRVIYSKTNIYSYESEYRCVWPLLSHEEHLGDLYKKFHAEEITGLYLGENAEDANKALFIKLSKEINPDISIYQISRVAGESLQANDISENCYQA
ncbi:MAG: DUF2971 domain-containing protein [Rickettsiales bacterium]